MRPSFIEDVPGRMRETGDRVRHEVESTTRRIAEGRQQARRWALRKAHTLTTQGTDHLWDLHLKALATAESLLDRAPGVPGIRGLSSRTRAWLTSVEAATTRPTIDGYDDLNVREIRGALHDLDHLGLLRVRHYETAHKHRKTILDALERELEHRDRIAGAR